MHANLLSPLSLACTTESIETLSFALLRFQVPGAGGQMANVARIYNDNVGVVSLHPLPTAHASLPSLHTHTALHARKRPGPCLEKPLVPSRGQ